MGHTVENISLDFLDGKSSAHNTGGECEDGDDDGGLHIGDFGLGGRLKKMLV